VNVATPSIVIFAIPYWIAEQKGYFKDENIEPTLAVVANQREIAQRVLNGASQFSITGPDATIKTKLDEQRRARRTSCFHGVTMICALAHGWSLHM